MAWGRDVWQEWTLGGEEAPELQSGPGGSSTGGQTTVWKGTLQREHILEVIHQVLEQPPSLGRADMIWQHQDGVRGMSLVQAWDVFSA